MLMYPVIDPVQIDVMACRYENWQFSTPDCVLFHALHKYRARCFNKVAKFLHITVPQHHAKYTNSHATGVVYGYASSGILIFYIFYAWNIIHSFQFQSFYRTLFFFNQWSRSKVSCVIFVTWLRTRYWISVWRRSSCSKSWITKG